MGPVTILDKSAFQGLSKAEHTLFQMWFMENLTMVLLFEIQGDLAKQDPKGVEARERVRELARKFGGSGGVVNLDYQTLATHSLFGASVPMTGQIIPMEWSEHRNEKGELGIVIDLSAFNHMILRWADGNISTLDLAMAKTWRLATRNLSLARLQERLNREGVILPRPAASDAIVATADSVLREPGLQEVLLNWLCDQLLLKPHRRDYVIARWRARPAFQTIRRFAPYAYHCLRALLSMVVAVRHRFIKWDSTHLIDLQYLYYLPFCQVFASEDRVHRLLAPGLLRKNQMFIRGQALKADLSRMHHERAKLDLGDPQQQYKFGSFPPQPTGSVVQAAWDLCMRSGGFGAEE